MQPCAKFQPIGRTATGIPIPHTTVPGNMTETSLCLGYTTCWKSKQSHSCTPPCKHGNAPEQATWVGGRQATARPEQCGVHVCIHAPNTSALQKACTKVLLHRKARTSGSLLHQETSMQASGLLCLVLVLVKPLASRYASCTRGRAPDEAYAIQHKVQEHGQDAMRARSFPPPTIALRPALFTPALLRRGPCWARAPANTGTLRCMGRCGKQT